MKQSCLTLRRTILGLLASLVLPMSSVRAQDPRPVATSGARTGTHTIEFETTQVTQADITVSPDDRWLIFTILGHLFRLPVEGGTAEQLTFGPYYDSDPVFSPDGQRVAFVSDREDSDRNIFVLELATGQITQITREPWADRPIWSPDGGAIVYLSQVGEPRPFNGGLPLISASVRRIPFGGGEPETLSAPRLVLSTFYLSDGRLAWPAMEPEEAGALRATTRVEVLSADGTISVLRTFEAFPDRVVASSKGDGLYCRCYTAVDLRDGGRRFIFGVPATEHLLFLPFRAGAKPEVVVPLSRVGALHNVWNFRAPFRFALSSDDETLYVGDAGRLWKIEAATGVREPVPFTARVRLEIQELMVPRTPTLGRVGTSAPPRVIYEPRLSPDGRSLVFGAAGYLWEQRLDGETARRLFEGNAYERAPAFSPDGRQLAYASAKHGREEIRVFTFESRETRAVAAEPGWGLSWSPDGQRLVFEDSLDQVVALSLRDGGKQRLAGGTWSPPHMSADGRWLYLSQYGRDGGQFYRARLDGPGESEAMTRLDRPLRDGLVSPNGEWLAFRRNSEILVAPLGGEPVREKDIRLVSDEGTDGYSFTPDGSALIYAVGNRVWLHRLADGGREEIPIRLELQRPTPPPLLLRRVRVLDFTAGAFNEETSIYIEQGRIRWIGSERQRRVPSDAVIVDGGGRFAVPGLFDMHTHLGSRTPRSEPEAFIAYGITSVRDMGSPLHSNGAMVDRFEFSAAPGPRSFYAGDNFNTRADSEIYPLVSIRDEQGARRYVRRWTAQGIHFIKVYASLSWRLHRAVAEEARRQGLPVVGHGMSVEEITKSVRLGYTSLEHFDRTTRAYDDILLLLAAAGTRWAPTLEVYAGNDLLLRNEPERLDDPKLQAFMPESKIRDARRVIVNLSPNMLRGLWVEWVSSIRPAHRLGVKLLAGTDAPHASSGIFPGISLHWELEHLVEAGLPTLDVLRIATAGAAEAVGAQDDLGTLEAGKLADIVLLDKNPLENIKNTQTIWRVLKGGWIFDPDRLRPPVSVEHRNEPPNTGLEPPARN